ncbi:hypothetical protein HYDPIDRAFT_108727 [Hydnomerulius pinastri MD-312]|nr:hypothetical protein HYDPIDRAFT_108727 [Hydnomerulius pinastri MD-312]
MKLLSLTIAAITFTAVCAIPPPQVIEELVIAHEIMEELVTGSHGAHGAVQNVTEPAACGQTKIVDGKEVKITCQGYGHSCIPSGGENWHCCPEYTCVPVVLLGGWCW